MKTIPMRKRISPVSSVEREFYMGIIPEKADDINSGKFFEKECDIPAHYRLEKKITNELLQEVNLEDAYKFIESKRGLDFANKMREKFKKEEGEISYELKKGSIIPIMKKFLLFVDELNSIYKTYSPCRKGCSFCCDIPLAISDLEAIIIKEYLEKNHIAYNKLNPINKKQENDKKDGLIGKEYEGIKCPFLKDNSCSIYSARPYNCRKYIAIGDNECNLDQKNSIIDEGYIIGNTYEWIVSRHMRKNFQRYITLLSSEQIRVTDECNLHGIYNLQAWQQFSDIRDNFSDIVYK
jgi:uncharacterized protein